MQARITIAICIRNRAVLLAKAVRCVLSQAGETPVEILIVDNGSTDHTAKVAAEFSAADPRVKYFCEPQPGLSIACNLALRHAAGEWVILLDDDATVEAGWLAACEIFFLHLSNPQVAVVGGPVIPQYEIPPPKWMDAEGTWGPKNQKPFCLARGHSPSECNSAYRRDVTLQAGGFDARLGHCGDTAGYREGADLNLRLQDAGHEIWWLPDAPVRHLIHAGRLNLKWYWHSKFNEGRTIAIQRLKFRTGSARGFYIAGRVLIAPFHCGMNLLLALVSFPFQNGRVVAKALLRAASIAGFAGELLRLFPDRGAAPVRP
jgi:glycosyltransferase involved in cell wall biosynthesis